MKDGDKPYRGIERRKAPRSAPSRQQGGGFGRANATALDREGRSGYGSESVRPYLRAQLRLRELMAGPKLGFETGGKRRNRF